MQPNKDADMTMTGTPSQRLTKAEASRLEKLRKAARHADHDEEMQELFDEFSKRINALFKRIKVEFGEMRRMELPGDDYSFELSEPHKSMTIGGLEVHLRILEDIEKAEERIRAEIQEVSSAFIEEFIAADSSPDSIGDDSDDLFEASARKLLPEIGFIEFCQYIEIQRQLCKDELEIQRDILSFVQEDPPEKPHVDPGQMFLFGADE